MLLFSLKNPTVRFFFIEQKFAVAWSFASGVILKPVKRMLLDNLKPWTWIHALSLPTHQTMCRCTFFSIATIATIFQFQRSSACLLLSWNNNALKWERQKFFFPFLLVVRDSKSATHDEKWSSSAAPKDRNWGGPNHLVSIRIFNEHYWTWPHNFG